MTVALGIAVLLVGIGVFVVGYGAEVLTLGVVGALVTVFGAGLVGDAVADHRNAEMVEACEAAGGLPVTVERTLGARYVDCLDGQP